MFIVNGLILWYSVALGDVYEFLFFARRFEGVVVLCS